MKKFNLQEFQKDPSRKVVTRDGRPVRIICTDAKGKYPVIGLALNKEAEVPENYTENGDYLTNDRCEDDIFFADEKKDGWVNIYKMPDIDQLEASCIFETKEEAEFYRGDDPNPNYVATTQITWEE